jgi:hypothetical protein
MYSKEFAGISGEQIAQAIKDEGYFAFEGAIEAEYVARLLEEVDFGSYQVNTNDVGVVCAGRQRFLSHCLAASRTAFDVITAPKVLEICRSYFQERFKLTNQRIYQTHTEAHMPWHTDNNQQTGAQLSAKHSMPGLLFLVYLSDVTENAFQLVKNSQLWSPQHDEIYLSDGFIESQYKEDILSFTMRKGTIIICTIHGVHRARPFNMRGYDRLTLLFQVDEVGSEHAGHGEKILVNTGFMQDHSPEMMDYLGFGFPTEYPPFPTTSVATMTPSDLIGMQRRIMPLLMPALLKATVKALVPTRMITNLKRLRWRLKAKAGGSLEKTDAKSIE